MATTHMTVSVNRLSYIRTTSLQKIQVNNGQSVYKLFILAARKIALGKKYILDWSIWDKGSF